MQLRPATNQDGDGIRHVLLTVLREYGLEADHVGVDADLDDVTGNYSARGGFFDVLIDDDGRIVGTVGLFVVDGEVCELRKMYLLRQHRGQGWGRRMLEHVLCEARLRGFRRMVLETSSKLVEAIRLYERYGFRPNPEMHNCCRCDRAYALEL
ncbi:MAG: GNAT family N-acetyltransferase [Planctomycetes bacterium]|nr:GNAT family N-acetyltransferase [Planctomycetota bacterium]